MTTPTLMAALASAALLPCLASSLQAQPSGANIRSEAVRKTPPANRGKAIPGRFVITLQPKVDPRAVASENGVEPDFVYTRVLNGFAGSIGEAARAGLLKDSRVVRVEPDQPVHATVTTTSWGLDRIDQRALPFNLQYNSTRTGRGVTVYIVDTGIRFDHQMFGGRAMPGIDTVGDGQNGNDCDGHGTHVAGIVGGGQGYGVAPGTRLVSARVLDCAGSGTTSGVIAALDWIANTGAAPSVVNLSLGGEPHAAMEDAVRRMAVSGFPVVVAAGNDNLDACQHSPARVPEAITIGATNKADSRASFSNFGSCLDLFAPGEAIVSAWVSGSTSLAYASGTSMASPHVAGAAALLLEDSPTMSSLSVQESLGQAATKGAVASAASANNHLLFVGSTAAPAPTSGGATITGTAGNDVVNRSATVPGQPLATDEADTINGLGGHDNLSGEGGNDTIAAAEGADAVNGGAGDDKLDGGTGLDRLSYVGAAGGITLNLAATASQATGGSGTDTIAGFEEAVGSYFADSITGTGGPNLLLGSGGGDSLNGGGGDDSIFGELHSDTLTGGPGRDSFGFDATLSATDNVDRITDFSAADDTFRLARAIFTALAAGPLPTAAFRTGAAAGDGDDRIVHDRTSGNVWYDPDGNGPAGQILFARINAGVTLTAADFLVY